MKTVRFFFVVEKLCHWNRSVHEKLIEQNMDLEMNIPKCFIVEQKAHWYMLTALNMSAWAYASVAIDDVVKNELIQYSFFLFFFFVETIENDVISKAIHYPSTVLIVRTVQLFISNER